MDFSIKFVNTNNQINEDYSGRAKCPMCSKTFSQKYLVPRHIKLEHENKRIPCSLCGALVRNIHTHQRIKHGAESKLKCSICLKIWKSKVLLREHCKQDHGSICVPNPASVEMKCPACEVIIVNKRSLWHSHIYYQHMVPLEMFECPVSDCSSRIGKIEEDYCLKKHLKSYHSLKIDKIHKCGRCPMKFLTSKDVENHEQSQHPNNRFNCSLCVQEFDCYSMMALHIFQQHKSILRGNCPGFKNINYDPSVKKINSKSDSSMLQIQNNSENMSFGSKEKNEDSLNTKSHGITSEIFIKDFVENSNSMEREALDDNLDNDIIIRNIEQEYNRNKTIEDTFTGRFEEKELVLPAGVKVVESKDEYIVLEINDKNNSKEVITEEPADVQTVIPKTITTQHKIYEKINSCEVLIDNDKDTNNYRDLSKDQNSCETSDFTELLVDKSTKQITDVNYGIVDHMNQKGPHLLTMKKTDNLNVIETPCKGETISLNTEPKKLVLELLCKEDIVVNDTTNVTVLEDNNHIENILEDIEEFTEVSLVQVEEYSNNISDRARISKTKFVCPIENCSSKFTRKDSVKLHLRDIHGSIKKKCNICLKEYTTESNLKTHIKSVHENIAAQCTWPNCHKVLSSWRQMKNHVRKHKQSESKHQCYVSGCNLIYKNLVTLNNHLKKHHLRK